MGESVGSVGRPWTGQAALTRANREEEPERHTHLALEQRRVKLLLKWGHHQLSLQRVPPGNIYMFPEQDGGCWETWEYPSSMLLVECALVFSDGGDVTESLDDPGLRLSVFGPWQPCGHPAPGPAGYHGA